MIGDIWTIMTKEWKELLLQRGNLRGGWLGLAVMAFVFGVYLPLMSGRGWVESPASLGVWMWVPLFLVTSVVADSFAGERERHTLETLLASRLSDRAILFGKIAATVGYGWGLTLGLLVLGLVTINVAHARGEILLYPLPVGLGAVVLTLLAATLVSCIGVLVSLRSSTVRQAAQTMSIAIMLLLFVPVFGFQALPNEMKRDLLLGVAGVDMLGVVLGLAVVLVALDAVFLAAAVARFQRARLILD